MSNQINGPGGVKGFINSTLINGRDTLIKTLYILNYNPSGQHAFANNVSASIAYGGNVARHLPALLNTNSSARSAIQRARYAHFPVVGEVGSNLSMLVY